MSVMEVVRKVMRRGKALVQKAYVSADKEGNDFGRIVPVRPTPFRSSNNELLQCAARGNGDVQY